MGDDKCSFAHLSSYYLRFFLQLCGAMAVGQQEAAGAGVPPLLCGAMPKALPKFWLPPEPLLLGTETMRESIARSCPTFLAAWKEDAWSDLS